MNARRIVTYGLVILTVCLSGSIMGGYALYSSHLRSSALEAAQTWARMLPLPPSAAGVTIETDGGPFTREFTIRFTAPSADLKSWLEKSPGTSSVQPVVKGRIRAFTIQPGSGAAHAEVIVDDSSDSVLIHTYWS